MKINPDGINLESFSKLFEYEKLSREVDMCDDIESLKNICKCYIKLYFKQQEVVSDLSLKSFSLE